MRSPSQLTNIPYSGRTPDANESSLALAPEPVLERDHEATLTLLLQGVVDRRMSIINIQHGATPADSVGMPVAAWVLGECLLHWALRWRSAEVLPTLLLPVSIIHALSRSNAHKLWWVAVLQPILLCVLPVGHA